MYKCVYACLCVQVCVSEEVEKWARHTWHKFVHISNLVTIMHASLNIFHMNFNEISQRLQDTPTVLPPTVAHYRPSPVALCMSLTRFATATAARTGSATATLQLQLPTGLAEKYAMKILRKSHNA